jgi:hypothetical protein
VADLIRVTIAVDLLVDDPRAMRDAAFNRLREAWTSEDDFPHSSASELSTQQVVNSLLADALPLEFPGCRRGRLEVESKGEVDGGDGSDVADETDHGSDASDSDEDVGDQRNDDEPGRDQSDSADKS